MEGGRLKDQDKIKIFESAGTYEIPPLMPEELTQAMPLEVREDTRGRIAHTSKRGEEEDQGR